MAYIFAIILAVCGGIIMYVTEQILEGFSELLMK